MAEKTFSALVLVLNELMESIQTTRNQRVEKLGNDLRGERKVDISIILSRS